MSSLLQVKNYRLTRWKENEKNTSAANSLPFWTFMKEIRLVVTEKKVIVSPDASKLIVRLLISLLWQFYFEEKKTTSKSNFPLNELLVRLRPLREKIPVVTQKYEIENGDESKLLACLDTSDN